MLFAGCGMGQAAVAVFVGVVEKIPEPHEVLQAAEYGSGVNSKIDEAGYFVNADLLQTHHEVETFLRRSD